MKRAFIIVWEKGATKDIGYTLGTSRFDFLDCGLSGEGKCETEIQRRLEIAKDDFQKLSKVLKDWKKQH